MKILKWVCLLQIGCIKDMNSPIQNINVNIVHTLHNKGYQIVRQIFIKVMWLLSIALLSSFQTSDSILGFKIADQFTVEQNGYIYKKIVDQLHDNR